MPLRFEDYVFIIGKKVGKKETLSITGDSSHRAEHEIKKILYSHVK